MLIAVIIPRDAILDRALKTPPAQAAIAAGFGLFTDGVRTELRPQCPPGWFRLAVRVRDMVPDTDSEAA